MDYEDVTKRSLNILKKTTKVMFLNFKLINIKKNSPKNKKHNTAAVMNLPILSVKP